MARRTRKSLAQNQGIQQALVIPTLPLSPCLNDSFGGMACLFNSEKFSDITIKCGKTTFFGHLNVLSLHTSFFTDAVSTGFQESIKREVHMRSCEPVIMWGFLCWCYAKDVDGAVPAEYLGDNLDIPMDAGGFFTHLYILAEFLVIPALKSFCVSKIRRMICWPRVRSSTWSAGPRTEEKQNPHLKVDFPRLVKEVYDNTSGDKDQLRVLLVEKARDGIRWLQSDEAYLALTKENAEFTRAVMLKLGDVVINAEETLARPTPTTSEEETEDEDDYDESDDEEYTCPSCGMVH